MTLSRRSILKATAAGLVAAPFISLRAANAAEFDLKMANNMPLTHPTNVRLAEAPPLRAPAAQHGVALAGSLAQLAAGADFIICAVTAMARQMLKKC